eukprot:TRINITY_DN600_c0_g1_i3.p2 TRINITY_DN600_c0_g1~~TRINITY_DN600_c0_g1_i3.p2  ORF type:complete len:211 (-),score=40.74 TRINITY_DN600_c0_g1_i3:1307-1939(-)
MLVITCMAGILVFGPDNFPTFANWVHRQPVRLDLVFPAIQTWRDQALQSRHFPVSVNEVVLLTLLRLIGPIVPIIAMFEYMSRIVNNYYLSSSSSSTSSSSVYSGKGSLLKNRWMRLFCESLVVLICFDIGAIVVAFGLETPFPPDLVSATGGVPWNVTVRGMAILFAFSLNIPVLFICPVIVRSVVLLFSTSEYIPDTCDESECKKSRD